MDEERFLREVERAELIKRAEKDLFEYWMKLHISGAPKRRLPRKKRLQDFLLSEEFISFALMTICLKENFP
jgi:hypothetical protein